MSINIPDMISKSDLLHCRYYLGVCRNSHVAKWDRKKEKFFIIRTKFDKVFAEEINHPEDDEGWDLFIPYELLPMPYSKEWKYDNGSAGKLIPKK